MPATKNAAKATTRKAVLKKAQIHDTDSGSPEAQIALLTKDINDLSTHLIKNPKDNSSRRGLLKKVGKRKSLLRYIASEDQKRYSKILVANKLNS
jgi:small subunit ribosomal protein S15